MTNPETITLFGGSRRNIERRVFNSNMRIQLGKDTDAVTRQIVRAYTKAWNKVGRLATSMAADAAEAMHSGRGLSPREIARLDRVDRAHFALERQIRELSKFTGVTVKGATASGIGKTTSKVIDQIDGWTGVDRRFTKPSGAAIEGLILRSTGRIEAATRALSARQEVALKDALFNGLVLGENPKTTAKAILDQTNNAFFGGLPRAQTIARTELADAHRYATRLAYGDSELVVGWKWLAQLGPRTCPACWAMHNTFHDKTEMQYGHQNCRCTMVPVLADDLPADHDLGDPEQIFWGLPREDQLAIMGPGRLKALEGGATLADLVHLKHNPEWRPAVATTTVSDLSGLAELNIATTPGDVITIPGETNESILAHAYVEGGLTINSLTGEQPTSGFVVARKGTSAVIDAREFFGPAGPNAVAQFLTTYGDLLDQPGAHMGMWYDTANGKVVLDVVQILADRDEAIRLGRAEDQIAIFDLDTFTEINTGGSGGYATPTEQSLKASSADVGKAATISVDGKVEVVTVVKTNEWGSVVVKGADGQTKVVWPDQILSIAEQSTADATKARLKEVEEISSALSADTGIPVNLAGLDPKAAHEIADSVRDLMHDWPGIAPTSIETGAVPGSYGVTNTSFYPNRADSAVTINRDFGASYKDWSTHMGYDEGTEHFHHGTADEPAQYTIEHEWGHVLDFGMFGHPGTPEGAALRRQVMTDAYNALYADQLAQRSKELGEDLTMTPDRVDDVFGGPQLSEDIRKDLSGYGNTQYAEMVAEAFAVYRDHGPGASKIADSVVRSLARQYRKKFGRWPNERDLDQILDPNEFQSDAQPALFSTRFGRAVGIGEAKPGLRVTVDGRFGTIEKVDGSQVTVRYEDGTTEVVFGGNVRHALRRST